MYVCYVKLVGHTRENQGHLGRSVKVVGSTVKYVCQIGTSKIFVLDTKTALCIAWIKPFH